VYSLAEGTAQRLSFEGPTRSPTWTTDGRSIGYSVDVDGDRSFTSLYLRAADGTGSAEQILAGEDNLWQMGFAPGDREVVFWSESAGNLFRATLGTDSGPVPLLESAYLNGDFTLSPDGRWIAYTSKASGSSEIHVRSYPDMGPLTVASIGGGVFPAWSGDGKEIFYWSRGWMTAGSVRYEGSRVTVVERAELFSIRSFLVHYYNRNYGVHPNGQEFVLVGRPGTRVVWRVNALASER